MDKAKKLFYYGLLQFAFFPIIPNRIKGLPVAILLIISLFQYFKSKNYKFNFKKVVFYASLYLLYIVSLFATTNFLEVDKTLTTRLSILVFPLIFGFVNSSVRSINEEQLLTFLYLYFIVSVVYCLLIVIYFQQIGFLTKNVDINLYYSYLTYEMWAINQHPIYASIFIAIAFLFGLKLLYTEKYIYYKLGLIIGLFLLLLMLLFLSRKSILLAMGLTSIIYLANNLKNKKQKVYLFSAIIIIGIIFLVNPITQKRFSEVLNLSSYTEIVNSNSTSIRFGIYKCAFESISEKPIFGHGIGDVKNELKKCYSYTSNILLHNNYNSHNQYLSIWISNGAFGLIIFLIFLYINFQKAILQKNTLFLSLLIFFCIVMLFENILERQSGVILFSLIINFFAFITIENRKNKSNFDKIKL